MYCELMQRATLEPTARYLAHDAARLVGVPGDRIGQWARWGHIRASVSAGDPHVYAFEDVAEALAVHLLLDAGFALPLVRRAVEVLGGAVAFPLSSGRLHVVDHRLSVERGEGRGGGCSRPSSPSSPSCRSTAGSRRPISCGPEAGPRASPGTWRRWRSTRGAS